MGRKTVGMGIVLVFAPAIGGAITVEPIHAAEPPDSAMPEIGDYQRQQQGLFDALRNDSSPRVQALAGRIYLDSDSPENALRPKPADVMARAAQLAPDDAFVQWLAADAGNYYSSQCGPTRWPEAEVAALLRLEPDNAGAWQYAVALAQAQGDATALDAALARFAAARRADDHFGTEIATWTRFNVQYPASSLEEGMFQQASAQAKPLLRALLRASSYSSSIDSALEKACTPDPNQDRAWQRLGWCVDAGSLLAARGSSFALRERGLKILAASGATKDDLADLKHPLDWLLENAATPSRNYRLFQDDPDDLLADWKNASSEIAATEHRLRRLGLPSTPPAGWLSESTQETAEEDAARSAWEAYIRGLLEDMRSSSDVRTQALALASEKNFGRLGAAAGSDDTQPKKDVPATEALAALAAANPNDLIVQWIAALASDDATVAAIAAVQRLDPDNAAAWQLSLPASDADAATILQRMAAAKRYDDHARDRLAIGLAVVRKHPMPAEIADGPMLPAATTTETANAIASKGTAIMLAAMSSADSLQPAAVHTLCQSAETDASRKNACTATGRLMLNSSGSVAVALIGAQVLRGVGALGAIEQDRLRRIAWWRETRMQTMVGGAALEDRYLDDLISTGSEIEALRLAATRAGKADPPADWKSPLERRAAKTK